MKMLLNVLGGLLMLFGAIWFLQGIDVLPGSFMTGDIRWAFYGGVAISLGAMLLIVARRRSKKV